MLNMAGNIKRSWEVPCSRSMNVSEVSMTSNVGVPGKWVFRIDEEILFACPNESKYAILGRCLLVL